MVLVFSHSSDASVNEVMQWLSFWKCPYKRFNVDQPTAIDMTGLKMSLSDNTLYCDGKKVDGVWFRSYPKFALPEQFNSTENKTALHRYIKSEQQSFTTALFNFCNTANIALNTCYSDNSVDVCKIRTLIAAKNAGLDIPESLLATSKKDISDFLTQHTFAIVKSIGNNEFFHIDGNRYALYTSALAETNIARLNESAFPCLIQKNIPKKFELRIFFIGTRLYPAAIFSQSNEKTAQDFRNYDDRKANRIVPFSLPEAIANRIIDLTRQLHLNTGSVDMIYSADNRYVFLEINPVGQFAMISNPCNYYIEQEIARFFYGQSN